MQQQVLRIKKKYRLIINVDQFQKDLIGLFSIQSLETLKQQLVSLLQQHKLPFQSLELNLLTRKENQIIIKNNTVEIKITLDGRFIYNQFQAGISYQVFQNKCIYHGQVHNKKPNGEGSFKWENGELYIGQWSNAQKHGIGQWIGTQNDYYIGQWVNGQQDGLGEHRWNGDIYLGQWKNSVKNGYGVEQFQNGDKYIGNYYFGKPQGQGEYRWVDGSIYSGEFQEGMRHGNGRYINKNGIIYEGEYSKDVKHGICKLIQNDESSYQNSFVHDHRDLSEVVFQKSDKIVHVAHQINQSSINNPICYEKPKQELTQRDNKTSILQNQQSQLNQTSLNIYQDPNIQFFHYKLQNQQLPEISKKKCKVTNKSARSYSMNQKRTSQLNELKLNQKSVSIDLKHIQIGDAYRTIKKKQMNCKDKNYLDLLNNNKKSIKNVFVY